jgi:hypothetical protein
MLTTLTGVGCGAAGAPVAARIGNSTVSQSEVTHWMNIKRAESELEGASKRAPTSSAQLRQDALAFLITAIWLEKQAAAQSISISPSEVNASYQQLLSSPTGTSFAESLKNRGMSRADEQLVLRLGALASKLRAKIAASHHGASPAQLKDDLNAFINTYRHYWKQHTTCEAGYVIPDCSNAPSG